MSKALSTYLSWICHRFLFIVKDPTDFQVGANGAPVAAITEVSQFQQKVVNEDSATEVEVSQHRVFLLGENRWEEPSRISGRSKQVGNSKIKDAKIKCLTCRGEGRLLCSGTCSSLPV